MATKNSDLELNEQEREEMRAYLATPGGLAHYRAFMSQADAGDPRGRTRLQCILDVVRAEADDPTHPNHAEAVKLLATWDAACRAEN
jgi:hypothetical protein